MRDRVPSFFLLVPGPWRTPLELVSDLANRGVAVRVADGNPVDAGAVAVDVVHDDSLANALAFGRAGYLPDELVARIATCRKAALVEIGMTLDDAPDKVATLGRALMDAGGVAVRTERSGGASPWEPWLEGLPNLIYASAVIIVEDEDDTYFTCGMHHFDLPDAQVALDDPQAALAWLDAFCIYQLAEKPALGTGHTFRPNAATPPRALERWPDHRHDPNDGRYNPFGVWRALPEGVAGLEASKLVPTIMPSLVAILMNKERSAGRPLTQAEVEAIVADSPATMMDLADAATLERSRGYADIEPRLAWEQWQIARTTL